MEDILGRKLKKGNMVCMQQKSRHGTLKVGILLDDDGKCYYHGTITSYGHYLLIENPSAFELKEKKKLEDEYKKIVKQKEAKKKIKKTSKYNIGDEVILMGNGYYDSTIYLGKHNVPKWSWGQDKSQTEDVHCFAQIKGGIYGGTSKWKTKKPVEKVIGKFTGKLIVYVNEGKYFKETIEEKVKEIRKYDKGHILDLEFNVFNNDKNITEG